MATLTRTQIETGIAELIEVVDDHYTSIQSRTAQVDNAKTKVLAGEFVDPVIHIWLQGLRDRLAFGVDAQYLRGGLLPWFQEYARLIDVPVTNDGQMMFLIKENMHTQGTPRTIQRRVITYGTETDVGSPVGTGSIHRLTVDRWDYPLEHCHLEKKLWRIVRGQNQGVKPGAEEFRVTGGTQERNLDVYQGSGVVGRITCRNARDSILDNSSFDRAFGSGTTDKVPGWTLDANHANVVAGTAGTDYFRASPGTLEADSNSLVITTAAKLTQSLTDRNITLARNIPYNFAVRWKKSVAGATGNLTLRMGATTQAYTVGTDNDTNWHTMILDHDKDTYLDNFDENALTIEIEVDSLSSGTITIDDACMDQYVLVDGTWWFPLGGATHYLMDDEFSFTDALTGSDSIIARWLAWAGFGSFPSAASSPTWPEP